MNRPLFVCNTQMIHKIRLLTENRIRGERMKKEEKQEETKPIGWEVTDPKPPVIRSGHMEQRREN